MARTKKTKYEKVAKYLADHPLAKVKNVAKVCGCSEIKKDLMSPRLQSESKNTKFKKNMLVKPHSDAEKILKEFKEKIEKNSENVGRNFAKIAREIHEGDAPERSIIGEATPKETLELIEDEIPVTPLPLSLIHI